MDTDKYWKYFFCFYSYSGVEFRRWNNSVIYRLNKSKIIFQNNYYVIISDGYGIFELPQEAIDFVELYRIN